MDTQGMQKCDYVDGQHRCPHYKKSFWHKYCYRYRSKLEHCDLIKLDFSLTVEEDDNAES